MVVRGLDLTLFLQLGVEGYRGWAVVRRFELGRLGG